MQKQINKFIEEFNKSKMDFTAFKSMIARTRLDEFYLILFKTNYGKLWKIIYNATIKPRGVQNS